ncbi:hypothetical protein C5748_14665 [Phyllobacterium phragmitis]|uniref:Flagellar assembly protein FliH n=1 Tax=Phyllobacterium phragmitis TaxID=2670329 RepID=A0A2S9IQ68_9HYPH|nr:hypothetical protein [Phyllobacterium phragmitis]PRD42667.1 hypothetical protein C5748_14665 [Phyllobacterium phragmitis]
MTMSDLSIASFLSDFSPRRIPDERVIILPASSEEDEPEEEASAEQAFEEAVDIELQVKQAFEAGREAGRAEADALYEAEKQRMQRVHEEEIGSVRTSVMNETADRLVMQLSEGLASLEESFSQQVTHLIEPLVAESVAKNAVADFAREVASLVRNAADGAIEIRGPHDLLDALRRQEGFAPEQFVLVEAEQAELSMKLGEMIVETRLSPLLAELKALVR